MFEFEITLHASSVASAIIKVPTLPAVNDLFKSSVNLLSEACPNFTTTAEF